MSSAEDVRSIEDGEVKKKKRFDARDWAAIAEMVVDEYHDRKKRRTAIERQWKEIDRQIRMEPDNPYKRLASGAEDNSRAWAADMELPFQAQTLEVLVADARSMMFPDSGSFFSAHALLSDDYLDRADFSSLIAGDENDVPSIINQDNADKIVEGFLEHFHNQYDFRGACDILNAESFKYGVGVGRVRLASASTYRLTARGTEKTDKKIPCFIPRSIKSTYLDDRKFAVINEGHVLGPATIYHSTVAVADLVLAANKGSNDPMREDGGWMPANIKKLPDLEGDTVGLVEYEGDLVVPRKTVSSLYIPNAIVTVMLASGADKTVVSRVVRFRFRKSSMPSYIIAPYHRENVDSAYAASPLMKGRPLQQAATDALNKLIDAGGLQNFPPIQYDSDDPAFAGSGGPAIHPGARIASSGQVNKIDIGDPGAMSTIFLALSRMYADLTGMNAARLAAQTKSHTTAFAKDAELARGQARTVDYVRQTLQGPMAQLLTLEYEMGRENLSGETVFYSSAYRNYIRVTKSALPSEATFDVHGAGGPLESRQKIENRLAALQLALNMDQLNIQTGNAPVVNVASAIRQILMEGGWNDIDAIARAEGVSGGAEATPVVSSDAGQSPGATITALQALGTG